MLQFVSPPIGLLGVNLVIQPLIYIIMMFLPRLTLD
jgi:hypothetical protein